MLTAEFLSPHRDLSGFDSVQVVKDSALRMRKPLQRMRQDSGRRERNCVLISEL